MIYYSTNWMGPISTRWYDERNIPFELKKTSGNILLPVVEYEDIEQSLHEELVKLGWTPPKKESEG